MARIKLKKDPAPVTRTHVCLDNIRLFGLQDAIPNSIVVGLCAGNGEGKEFKSVELFPMGPLPGQALYDKDPEAFDRVVAAVLEYLVETGTVDGTVELVKPPVLMVS